MTAELEPGANSPEDLGYMSPEQRPPPPPKPKAPAPELAPDHFVVLRAAEAGELPNLVQTRWRMALSECEGWGLVHKERSALTPAGVAALAARRAR